MVVEDAQNSSIETHISSRIFSQRRFAILSTIVGRDGMLPTLTALVNCDSGELVKHEPDDFR